MTTHTMFLPHEPRHTVHDVALERAPAELSPPAFRELALAHAKAALDVLVAVMNDGTVTASTRVIAASEILDRGLGKPAPTPVDDAPEPLRLATIRRIIVDPRHSDEPGLHPAPATSPL